MPADPALLKRIRRCRFARGGRVIVRFRANGCSLFARRSGLPLVRLRLTGETDEVVVLCPSHRGGWELPRRPRGRRDRKSTRLNSSHANISYAVFCLKKKKIIHSKMKCIGSE